MVLRSACIIEPHNKSLNFDLGAAQFMQRNYSNAVVNFLKSTPLHDEGYFFAARCYEAVGNNQQAISHYKTYLSSIKIPRKPTEGNTFLIGQYRPLVTRRLKALDKSFKEGDFPLFTNSHEIISPQNEAVLFPKSQRTNPIFIDFSETKDTVIIFDLTNPATATVDPIQINQSCTVSGPAKEPVTVLNNTVPRVLPPPTLLERH
ncbi:MAG: hypothetical protein K2X81_14430 [Candidatus Obscuribacterales bacterium]|nr:hypothetical protein [Candidatus Obscuribacterales bacterium]